MEIKTLVLRGLTYKHIDITTYKNTHLEVSKTAIKDSVFHKSKNIFFSLSEILTLSEIRGGEALQYIIMTAVLMCL